MSSKTDNFDQYKFTYINALKNASPNQRYPLMSINVRNKCRFCPLEIVSSI